jgi:muramoyltetrapeptide carboxypeptidase LdcA involved in peptidoglycan recycling
MKPKFLNDNSKLYFVAPSFGCTTFPYEERLLKAMRELEVLGYQIKLGKNCFKSEGIFASASPMERAEEFMEAYKSDCDAIISVGGGELMVEMLDYVNFEQIKNLPPKWFMGFSDNTNLTYTLTTLCDIETIYGVNAPRFYDLSLVDAKDSLRMLHGESYFEGYQMFELNEIEEEKPFNKINFDTNKIITPFKYTHAFEGIMLGGCLDCLVGLCGTKYDKTNEYIKKHKDEGVIFYLESCDLNPISYRRALIQLKNAGWFDNVKGFVIGRAYHYGEEIMGVSFESSTIDILSSFNVPILINVDLGHLKPSMPIRNGAKAKVTYENSNIIIEY